MKLFVTGGSGFIGNAVIRRLVEDGHEVTGLVHRISKAEAVEGAGASVVVGDLLEAGTWTKALRESNFVISATQPIRHGEKVSFAEARRRSYQHGQMTGNLFLAAEGSGVRGIALTYGVQGFGNRGYDTIMPGDDLEPVGYERAVSGAYWHVDKTSRKTKVPLVNIFTGWVYGPGGWFEAMVRGIRNGTARIIGDGLNYMSLIHINDLASAYSKVAQKMPLGERFCLVDDHPVTQRELLEYVAGQLGARTPKSVDAESYAAIAGELAAETYTCSTRVSNEKMLKRLVPALRYPTYKDGMPGVIERIVAAGREERAA